MSVFDNIINNIREKQEANVTVYIAVGSSAGKVKYDEVFENWKIDPMYEQQFPPFLSTLKLHDLSLPIHIILIDEKLENPPFVVCDSKKNIQEGWLQHNTFWFNPITNIYVYPIYLNITYPPYIEQDQNNGYIDISTFLIAINQNAMKFDWFVVFHDFCGRNVKLLAEHYDNSLIKCKIDHRDHIIYGLGARFDGGCYIDLSTPVCQFVYKFDTNSIKTFNPYTYDYNTLKQIYNTKSDDTTESKIIRSQITTVFENLLQFLKTNLFSVTRQFKILATGGDVKIHSSSYKYISNKYGIDFQNMIDSKDYKNLMIAISNVLLMELSCYIDQNVVKNTINNILIEQDPYKISKYLEKILPNTFV
jgi:hypothetical protein